MTSSPGFTRQRMARSMPSLPPTVTTIWLAKSYFKSNRRFR